MFNKTYIILVNKFTSRQNVRWASNLRSTTDSYLHNQGSEPLTLATLGDVIEETVHKFPGRVAVKSMHEGISLTYEELLLRADSMAYGLRNQGLQKGDRVGVWSHNSVSYLVSLVAAARAGLISVLINPAYEKKELSFCIKKSGMKCLLISDALPKREYYRTLEQLIPELKDGKPGLLKSREFPFLSSIIADGRNKLPGTISYKSLTEDYKNRSEVSQYVKETKPSDGSIIHFTSGTTGEPKAALDSHLGVVNNTYFTGKRNTFHEGHHNICVQVPIFHALGSVVTVLGGFRHGASLVLAAPIYDISANVKALFGEKCTAITGTPTMFVDILSQVRAQGQEVPSELRVAVAAGAPCSPQLIRDIQTHLNAESVKSLYGLTETTACIFQSNQGDSIDVVAETVGYIQDHVEVKVVNEQGEIVPFETPGELVVRGYNNMICYWDEPEKTRQTLDKDGWLKTGDKFTISKDGYGRIVGRIKDIIVRGGENIAPKEIEDLLNTHPDVEESQVVGVSDKRVGEELCAVVRLREGAALSLDDVTKHLTGEIARFKFPRILKVTQEFPKTASGKIQKYRLREMIEKGLL
ncbi:acyl-CoA synthetase family member 2, mitochondrial [Bombyx mandarina]|uniref:Medium-chain acyl-CoA ligase ACSF2, mitochondrial n=1 Tax=Bombyx mandarina TaxID=7092 RepID=A0A6J2KD75_BOMMA|nr:acyl-CoA synthetase family member 2, mitochondrial [Bombyx mandarina]